MSKPAFSHIVASETMKNGISVQTDLAEGIQLLEGDRVQLQQVILNLVMNAVEAMNATSEGAEELLISTRKTEPYVVLVVVRDSGPGLAPATLDQLFDAFYTEARRSRAGAVDLSLDHRNAWGSIVGKGQCASRRDF